MSQSFDPTIVLPHLTLAGPHDGQKSRVGITIGNFDGVHRGHAMLVNQLRDRCVASGLTPVAIVIDPHAAEVLRADEAPPRILLFHDKVKALTALGIEAVYRLNTTKEVLDMEPEQFLTEVLAPLQPGVIQLGDDFRFGRRRAGHAQTVKQWATDRDCQVYEASSCIVDGERVSSTALRQALATPDLARAAAILGRPLSVSGVVCFGQQLGQQLGFPTANVALPLRPAMRGVFAVRMRTSDGQTYPGVANFGRRPTVDGTMALLEVHALGVQLDLYDQEIDVELVQFLRSEQKFDGVTQLKQQIARDCADAAEVFQSA